MQYNTRLVFRPPHSKPLWRNNFANGQRLVLWAIRLLRQQPNRRMRSEAPLGCIRVAHEAGRPVPA